MLEKATPLLSPYSAQTQFYKALAHPVRLAILDILRNGEECVCHMEAALGYRQAYLSQQLSVLREANIIQDRRDGWNIFYRIVKPEIFPVMDQVRIVLGEKVKDIPQRQNAEKCPCPKCAAEKETALKK